MKTLNELSKFYFDTPAPSFASASVPTPAPPVTADNQAVLMAEHDMAQSNLMKKSIKNTIMAGDTGGFTAQNPLGNAGNASAGYKAKLG